MNLRLNLAATAFALAALASAAQADVLFSFDGATAAMPTNTSVSYTFDAGAGPGALSFVLDGYASLDGQNGYEDDFSLSLNGLEILRGTFNLGGGGADVLYFAPLGATWQNVSGNGLNVTWAGGRMEASTPLDLVQGQNTLTFGYLSLPAPGHAGFQGTGDEAWGVERILVTGAGAAAAVPEPAAWTMMILGFCGLGAMLRHDRRRGRTLAAASRA